MVCMPCSGSHVMRQPSLQCMTTVHVSDLGSSANVYSVSAVAARHHSVLVKWLRSTSRSILHKACPAAQRVHGHSLHRCEINAWCGCPHLQHFQARCTKYQGAKLAHCFGNLRTKTVQMRTPPCSRWLAPRPAASPGSAVAVRPSLPAVAPALAPPLCTHQRTVHTARCKPGSAAGIQITPAKAGTRHLRISHP